MATKKKVSVGRKSLSGKGVSPCVSIRFPEASIKKMKRIAKSEGISVNQLVRSRIQWCMDQEA